MSTPEEDDEVWRTIVENYGERPDFPERAAEPDPAPVVERPEEPTELAADSPDDHFVPPPAPPTKLPQGPRGVAWAGVFGVPTLTLLMAMTGIRLPGWAAFFLLVWFVGGFVYLVATMRHPDDTDGWDDGAVV